MFATRMAAWGLVLSLVCASPAWAQEDSDPFGGPATSAANSQADVDAVTPVFYAEDHPQQKDKIRKVLREPLRDGGLKYSDTPLSKVVEFLRDEYEVEVQLDLKALDDLGLSPDDPITVNLRHISLESALTMMLRQLDLTYVIVDETLLITSEEEALTRLVVGVYPVGDILAVKTDDRAGKQDEGEHESDPKPEEIEWLIDSILATVASDTWVENGGPEADIRALQPGLLIVSQTADVHEQIQMFLAALRRAKQHDYAVPHHGKTSEQRRQEATEEARRLEAYRRNEDGYRRGEAQQDRGGGGMF